MRIAFLLPSLARRGPILFTETLIKNLKGRVEAIDVYYFDDIVDVDMGVPSHRISFFHRIDFEKYDIVHTTMARPDLYALLHSASVRRKWIVTAHNFLAEDCRLLYGKFKGSIYSLLWLLGLRGCNTVVVSTKAMSSYYAEHLGRSRSYPLIPYGIPVPTLAKVDEESIRLLESLRERFTVIGSVGLLIKRKGYDQLLYFLRDNPKFAVALVGEGPERAHLERLAEELGVKSRLLLLGFKPNSTNFYKYFDIYALTSYSEGMSLAMLDAFALGLPLICPKLELYDDFVDHPDVMYRIDDIASLTATISRVAQDLEKYRKISKEIYLKHFELNTMIDRYMALYREVAAAKA